MSKVNFDEVSANCYEKVCIECSEEVCPILHPFRRPEKVYDIDSTNKTDHSQ